jgi:hypothetical protein
MQDKICEVRSGEGSKDREADDRRLQLGLKEKEKVGERIVVYGQQR